MLRLLKDYNDLKELIRVLLSCSSTFSSRPRIFRMPQTDSINPISLRSVIRIEFLQIPPFRVYIYTRRIYIRFSGMQMNSALPFVIP